jgi:hypothetical protein
VDKFCKKLVAMPHCAWHSAESELCAMSQNTNRSAFVGAVKVTIYQKISLGWSCLPHENKNKFELTKGVIRHCAESISEIDYLREIRIYIRKRFSA